MIKHTKEKNPSNRRLRQFIQSHTNVTKNLTMKYLSFTFRISPRLKLSSSSAVALKSYLATASMVIAVCSENCLAPAVFQGLNKKNKNTYPGLCGQMLHSEYLLPTMTRFFRVKTSHKG